MIHRELYYIYTISIFAASVCVCLYVFVRYIILAICSSKFHYHHRHHRHYRRRRHHYHHIIVFSNFFFFFFFFFDIRRCFLVDIF